MRSGTAIGALVREAEHAESTADFIHKMDIVQKEANETDYWLELLYGSDQITESIYRQHQNAFIEIRRILASIIITMKNKKKADSNAK